MRPRLPCGPEKAKSFTRHQNRDFDLASRLCGWLHVPPVFRRAAIPEPAHQSHGSSIGKNGPPIVRHSRRQWRSHLSVSFRQRPCESCCRQPASPQAQYAPHSFQQRSEAHTDWARSLRGNGRSELCKLYRHVIVLPSAVKAAPAIITMPIETRPTRVLERVMASHPRIARIPLPGVRRQRPEGMLVDLVMAPLPGGSGLLFTPIAISSLPLWPIQSRNPILRHRR